MRTIITIISCLFLCFFLSCNKTNDKSYINKSSFSDAFESCDIYHAQMNPDSLHVIASKVLSKSKPGTYDYYKALRYLVQVDYCKGDCDVVLKKIKSIEKENNLDNFPDIKCMFTYDKARTLQRLSRTNEAINTFRECLGYDSGKDEERKVIHKIICNSLLQILNTYQSVGERNKCLACFDSIMEYPSGLLKEQCMRDINTLYAYSLYEVDDTLRSKECIEKSFSMKLYNPDNQHLFRDYSYAAAIYYVLPDGHSKSEEYCKKALEVSEHDNSVMGVQWIYTLLGRIYQMEGRITESIELYKSSIKRAQRFKDLKSEADSYNKLSSVYSYWNLFRQSNEYSDKAIACHADQQYCDSTLLGESYITKGMAMNNLGKIDSALYYLYKSEQCFSKQPYRARRAEVDVTLGSILIDNTSYNKLDEGIVRLRHALQTAISPLNVVNARFYLAKGYIMKNCDKEGEALLDSIYNQLHSQSDYLYTNANIYQYAVMHYLGKGNLPMITKYMVAFNNENKLRENYQISRSVTASMAEYQVEKKEQQLKLANTELVNYKLSLRFIYMAFAFSVALLSAFVIYFYGKRKRLKLAHEIMKLRFNELSDNLKEEIEHNKKTELRLQTLLGDKSEILKAESVSPAIYREEGEAKFRTYFTQLYPSFLSRLREITPNITRSEEIIAMLIVLDQTPDQMVDLLCIARTSINQTRYRLRKKMHLLREDSLETIVKEIAKIS